MIEEFNGVFFLIIYIILFIGFIYYAFQTLFATAKFIEKYSIDQSGAFMVRFVGTFISAFALIQLYIFFDGIEGHWAFFLFGLLQSVIAFVSNLITVEFSDYKTNKGEKITKEGYIAPLVFTILWVILIYGVQEKIYV
ncbi:MAG: hypothetical protein CFH01_00104 [Alphaproteobacteria bacterium MarineAlpha2_Bin1]|nr:MAG: hypothetical protein CFH01_00104 [Alphaproteobacteria bacterium MarineAlpha2_Bin1]